MLNPISINILVVHFKILCLGNEIDACLIKIVLMDYRHTFGGCLSIFMMTDQPWNFSKKQRT
jgi:hypothetical protein